ncbi:MAG: dihydrodipicolinate synthase family protein [Candidatus Sumerlaeota bacterium]|nr:dihydrodipicolinate synthase family protein [Candidatus Sumerlaeota bacterium]
MKKLELTGLIAAAHTPFDAKGELNLAVIEKQAEHLVRNGIGVVFVGGSTGECSSLSLDERLRLAARWLEVARGTKMQIIVHAGSNCLTDSRALARQAESLGALAIAAVAPSYFKPASLDALIESMRDIAAAAPETPFYFYDIPAMTGVNFPTYEFLEQARDRIPTLAGAKFTSLDMMGYQLCLRAAGGAYNILWGYDEHLLAALALGANGAVGSTYNFAAPIYIRLLRHFAEGDLDAAREEQFRSVRLIQTLVRYGFMGAAKAVMNMLGVNVGPARLPILNLTPAQSTQLRRDLEEMGFFEWIH